MGFDIEARAIENCNDWVLKCLADFNAEVMANMAKVLWGIWSARNLIVWEGKNMTADIAMQWSNKQVLQWQDIQKTKEKHVASNKRSCAQNSTRWKPPDPGILKVNVDAAVKQGSSQYGVGMVLRDQEGKFCKARVICHAGEVGVVEAETKGILEALAWATQLGISKVVVESDSWLSVQAVNNDSVNHLEVGHMIQECRTILSQNTEFSVSFTRKQANRVAHLLARVRCEAVSFQDFLSPPHIVVESLMYDVAGI